MNSPLERRARSRHLILVALPFLAAACGDGDEPALVDPAPDPAPAGDLEVAVVVSGEDPDLIGYSVWLDDADRRHLGGAGDPDAVTFEGVTAGEHEVTLTDATDNCEVAGANPRSVTVTEGQTASTTFEIACTAVEKIALVGDQHLDDLDLLVMHADGQDPFELSGEVASASEEQSLAWSPDGRTIAYQLTDGGIHLVDETGRDGRLLTGLRSYRPAWSPDGARVVFQSDRTGDLDVWIVNADGSGETNLTADPGVADGDPAWAPDGTRLVFEKGGEIWTMAPDGSDGVPVVDADFGVAANPAWSPDGSRIAFLGDDGGEAWEVWTVAPDGSDLRRLTSRTEVILEEDAFPRWAPDGTRIAIQGFESVVSGASVWVVEADGSSPRHVAAGREPGWSSDGSRIVFVTGDGGNRIGIVDADGSGARTVGRSILIAAHPAWRPRR